MEAFAYRDNLTDILEYTGGRRLLTVAEVGRYTGLRDVRTIRRKFPYFRGNYISAATLARCLSGEVISAVAGEGFSAVGRERSDPPRAGT